jgi:hypothetical protein
VEPKKENAFDLRLTPPVGKYEHKDASVEREGNETSTETGEEQSAPSSRKGDFTGIESERTGKRSSMTCTGTMSEEEVEQQE